MTENMIDVHLDVQVGGNHYAVMAIQPIEFAMHRGYDPATFSVMKYLSRHRRKDGPVDLEKAAHFAMLREKLAPDARPWLPRFTGVSLEEYISANHFAPQDALLLRTNDACFENDLTGNLTLHRMIFELAVELYGVAR